MNKDAKINWSTIKRHCTVNCKKEVHLRNTSENSAILTQIECYIELFEQSIILIDNNDRQN